MRELLQVRFESIGEEVEDAIEEETICQSPTKLVDEFSDQKVYGFTTLDESGEDLLLHQSTAKSEGFELASVVVKRSAAAMLSFRAKNGSIHRVLIDKLGAPLVLIPLLHLCTAASRSCIQNQFGSRKVTEYFGFVIEFVSCSISWDRIGRFQFSAIEGIFCLLPTQICVRFWLILVMSFASWKAHKWKEKISDEHRVNMILHTKQLVYASLPFLTIVPIFFNVYWFVASTVDSTCRNSFPLAYRIMVLVFVLLIISVIVWIIVVNWHRIELTVKVIKVSSHPL